MAERRPAGRPRRKPAPGQRGPQFGPEAGGERIAKYLARAGVASRRACEALIEAGQVVVDGRRVKTPAEKVTGREEIRVHGLVIEAPERTRLWRYHKPAGLITTNMDPAGRRTVFDELPKTLPRTVTVGRLDLNTEGLLLLTNDGALARQLEHPSSGVIRSYRARAFGRADSAKLARLARGISVDGDRFGAIDAALEQETGANAWLRVSLKEGRKREVRRALEAVDLKVNRLIRVAYGPFELADLKPGAVEEVAARDLERDLAALLGPGFSLAEPVNPRPVRARRAKPRLGKRGRGGTLPNK
ncbi:MAG: pseudouridine synthase [Pseudomonadota bacterium]